MTEQADVTGLREALHAAMDERFRDSIGITKLHDIIDETIDAATPPVAGEGLDAAAKSLIRSAISDAYYEAKTDGETPAYASHDAARRVLEVLEGYGIRVAALSAPTAEDEREARLAEQRRFEDEEQKRAD